MGRKLMVFRGKPKWLHRTVYCLCQSWKPLPGIVTSDPNHARASLIGERSRAPHSHLEWLVLGRNQPQGWREPVNNHFLNIAKKLQRKMEVRDLGPRNLHADGRLFQPRLRLLNCNAHVVRQVDGNKRRSEERRV